MKCRRSDRAGCSRIPRLKYVGPDVGVAAFSFLHRLVAAPNLFDLTVIVKGACSFVEARIRVVAECTESWPIANLLEYAR